MVTCAPDAASNAATPTTFSELAPAGPTVPVADTSSRVPAVTVADVVAVMYRSRSSVSCRARASAPAFASRCNWAYVSGSSVTRPGLAALAATDTGSAGCGVGCGAGSPAGSAGSVGAAFGLPSLASRAARMAVSSAVSGRPSRERIPLRSGTVASFGSVVDPGSAAGTAGAGVTGAAGEAEAGRTAGVLPG